MFRRTYFLFAVVALTAVLLAACGGSGGGSSSGNALNVTVANTEFKFDPAMINAAPGQTINLTVTNKGAIQHTFIIAQANLKVTIEPGQTQTKTFTAPAAGTYVIDCDVPGHREAGMVGQLVVK